MIGFRHEGKSVSLNAGDLWAVGGIEKTYRDTSAEELWSIIHEVENGTPWREAVGRRYAQSNPWLHQIVTSPERDLFFRLHPPPAGCRALDIGAGWGQIALPLARTSEVTALEPTPERLAFIRAVAAQEGVDRQIHFVQADFFDIEFETKFDLIACIGVLEWVPKFRAGNPRDVQVEFLRRARTLLAPGGRLVVGIENRLGLKYLLGAADDHLGVPNIGVYDNKLADQKWQTLKGESLRVFTFTQIELAEMLASAGLPDQRFFAALPDYKLPQRILALGADVDSFFQQGGFVAEHDGSRGQPLSCQDELRSHYQSLAHLGIASEFVPSFYVSCGT
jgi:2-polyprenyl-3-methyl-5-hydroxy-6-metoxy-1,4-benzoquinol methylase